MNTFSTILDPANEALTPVSDGAVATLTRVGDPLSSPDLREDELLDDELLVEEISIDGMCGVY